MGVITRFFLKLLFIFCLASIPLVFYIKDQELILKFNELLFLLSDFSQGLINGKSWTFIEGDRTPNLIFDLFLRLQFSFFYLIIAGFIAILISLVLGIRFWQTYYRYFTGIINMIGIFPSFILILLMQITIIKLNNIFDYNLFLVASASSDKPAYFLPIFTLVILSLIYTIDNLSNKTRLVLNQDYILFARSKGLSANEIYFRHIYPNVTPYLKAEIPKITFILLSNLFIVEYLYNIRGITILLFSHTDFGYQYNVVVFCLIFIFLLYIITYLTLLLFIKSIERFIQWAIFL
ncbi:ABC transporter permease subunit [Cytobacillus kochii]|uniref:ABC transporter permease subunit n=1 Tax=Cytobacillus kochii TaxID=859143 RepID=UPI002784A47C|nr:ABC transporter permease subunit [Cytobacillus kochii]MDQ0186658.1 ABC-type dipeptide/oligopeptide/nickel transport system permease component [Cytobacillus kochii]